MRRLKNLLFGESDTDKILRLSKTKDQLFLRRNSFDHELAQVTEIEQRFFANGKNALTANEKKRWANEVLRVRREQKRLQGMINLINHQINIVFAEMHNIHIMAQAKVVKLPDSEEIAQYAADAEQSLKEIKESANLSSSLELDVEMSNEDEAAIIAEFDNYESNKSEPEPEPDYGAAHSAARWIAENESQPMKQKEME